MVTKLTNWKNEPTISDLTKDFSSSKASHDAWVADVIHWRNLMNVEGKAKPPKVTGKSAVQPKLIRKQAEWRFSSLSEPFLNSPKIFQVLPRTYEDLPAAKQNELLLNYQFATKLNKVKFIDDLVRAVVTDGTAIVRLSWYQEQESKETDEPLYAYTTAQDDDNALFLAHNYDVAYKLQQESPEEYEQLPEDLKAGLEFTQQSGELTNAVPVGTKKVFTKELKENHPEISILNPENVYIDPSCDGDFSKALFVIISFETNKAELKKSGLYTNLDDVDWSSNSLLDNAYHTSSTPTEFNFNDLTRRKCVAYEYWGFYDIHGNGTLEPIVATWVGDTIIRMDINPFPDKKLPFVLIPYLPVARSIYGQADAVLLEENQRTLGATLRGIVDLLGSSANSQQGFAKGMLDPVNKERFQRGLNYEFNPAIPIQQGYIQHSYPEVSQTAIALMEIMNQDAEALTGVKSFSTGLSGNAYGSTAAGTQGLLDAASKREMAILRRIAKGMSDIGTKIISMNAEFLSPQEVIRITNSQFVKINKDEIKGNFDLIVDINTAEVDNTKAQDLAFLLQTIGPNLGPELLTDILAEIAELKRMPSLAEKIRNYKPQPDHASEIKAQRYQAEIMLNQAKAENLNAETQATQLDTQLTASGIKHQQAMEKQEAQARGNQKLQITKALTSSIKPGYTEPNFDAAIGYNRLTEQGLV